MPQRQEEACPRGGVRGQIEGRGAMQTARIKKKVYPAKAARQSGGRKSIHAVKMRNQTVCDTANAAREMPLYAG